MVRMSAEQRPCSNQDVALALALRPIFGLGLEGFGFGLGLVPCGFVNSPGGCVLCRVVGRLCVCLFGRYLARWFVLTLPMSAL